MREKLDVHDLRPGMYVAELDRPWRETPFLFQGFYIESHADIEQIKRYCAHVFVDADLGAKPAAPSLNTHDGRVELEMLKRQARAHYQTNAYNDASTLAQEVEPARAILREARAAIANIMEDARLGRALDAPGARRQIKAMTQSIVRNPDALMCLTQLKEKDAYTVEHSLRVCILSLAFGRHLGVPEAGLHDLGLGALLHDVGKAKIPLEILNKPGALTPEEFNIIQTHVPAGVKLLEDTHGIPRTALEVASGHHERYSGTGYARGLKGREIGNAAMITAIVDCYDAMTSDRVYKAAISSHNALKKMYTWRDRDFEGRLVEHFIQCMGIYPIGSLVELNTGHVGVVTTINRLRYLRPQVVLVLNRDKQRYGKPRTVDLLTEMRDEANQTWEIKSVLEPGTYGIEPASHLPKAH